MKTIAVIKLNRGAWIDYRDKLIQKFKAEGSLDTYSDDFVRTHDATYWGKIIPVTASFLDPLLGFEGRCEGSDLVKFMKTVMAKIEQEYNSEKIDLAIQPAGVIATPPTPTPTPNPIPQGIAVPVAIEKPATPGPVPTQNPPQTPNSAPGTGDKPENGQIPTNGAEGKE